MQTGTTSAVIDAPAAEAPGGFDPRPVHEWLIGGANLVTSDAEFLDAFASRVCDAGLPLDRMTTGIPVLHPQIAGHSYLWVRGEEISERYFPATPETLKMMQASPIRAAYQEGRDTRHRIPAAPEPGEFGIYAELRGEGYTDYAAFAVHFSDGSHKATTIATRHPEGFSDEDIAAFRGLLTSLAPFLEIRTLKLMSRALLDVYIGRTAGARVLKGEIRRGEGEVIQAVIWFSDLRNSTRLSGALSGEAMIGHLNEFFSLVTKEITANGGEVLKFIGDSVLAIFPCDSIAEEGCAAASRAETAARAALAEASARNRTAANAGKPEIEFGIALHIGKVFYGNVGGEARLDFTVIGPAVNIASRIEGATKETQRPLLASSEFAAISLSDFDEVGAFQFNGIDGWTPVFAPAYAPELAKEPVSEAA